MAEYTIPTKYTDKTYKTCYRYLYDSQHPFTRGKHGFKHYNLRKSTDVRDLTYTPDEIQIVQNWRYRDLDPDYDAKESEWCERYSRYPLRSRRYNMNYEMKNGYWEASLQKSQWRKYADIIPKGDYSMYELARATASKEAYELLFE